MPHQASCSFPYAAVIVVGLTLFVPTNAVYASSGLEISSNGGVHKQRKVMRHEASIQAADDMIQVVTNDTTGNATNPATGNATHPATSGVQTVAPADPFAAENPTDAPENPTDPLSGNATEPVVKLVKDHLCPGQNNEKSCDSRDFCRAWVLRKYGHLYQSKEHTSTCCCTERPGSGTSGLLFMQGYKGAKTRQDPATNATQVPADANATTPAPDGLGGYGAPTPPPPTPMPDANETEKEENETKDEISPEVEKENAEGKAASDNVTDVTGPAPTPAPPPTPPPTLHACYDCFCTEPDETCPAAGACGPDETPEECER